MKMIIMSFSPSSSSLSIISMVITITGACGRTLQREMGCESGRERERKFSWKI